MFSGLLKLVRSYIFFCEVNGGYITAFSLILPQIWINISSVVFNEYQGGCLFPYISEVGREGMNKLIFVISTFVSSFPWIVYSMYYMETNVLYGKYIIKKRFQYYFFVVLHVIMCMMQCSCAISFLIASIYDLLHYPMIHETYTTRMCIYGNLAYAIDSFLSYLYLNSPWEKMKWSKIIIISLSWIMCVLFGSLYYIPGCSVQLLPMDQCFQWTSESNCFFYQNNEDISMTILRYYPTCKIVHFCRGLSEYLALLFSMMHFSLLRGDIVIMRYEMCKWKITKEKEKQSLKEGEDKKTISERVNRLVAKRIVNTSNIYLIYYLRQYWVDYDNENSIDVVKNSIVY